LPDIVKETRDCCIFEAIATLPTFLECDAVTAVIGTREMKINGNVGIGTTAPGVALHVVGEVNITGISGDGTGKAVCIKSDRTLGTCSDAVGGSGTCTCG